MKNGRKNMSEFKKNILKLLAMVISMLMVVCNIEIGNSFQRVFAASTLVSNLYPVDSTYTFLKTAEGYSAAQSL